MQKNCQNIVTFTYCYTIESSNMPHPLNPFLISLLSAKEKFVSYKRFIILNVILRQQKKLFLIKPGLHDTATNFFF